MSKAAKGFWKHCKDERYSHRPIPIHVWPAILSEPPRESNGSKKETLRRRKCLLSHGKVQPRIWTKFCIVPSFVFGYDHCKHSQTIFVQCLLENILDIWEMHWKKRSPHDSLSWCNHYDDHCPETSWWRPWLRTPSASTDARLVPERYSPRFIGEGGDPAGHFPTRLAFLILQNYTKLLVAAVSPDVVYFQPGWITSLAILSKSHVASLLSFAFKYWWQPDQRTGVVFADHFAKGWRIDRPGTRHLVVPRSRRFHCHVVWYGPGRLGVQEWTLRARPPTRHNPGAMCSQGFFESFFPNRAIFFLQFQMWQKDSSTVCTEPRCNSCPRSPVWHSQQQPLDFFFLLFLVWRSEHWQDKCYVHFITTWTSKRIHSCLAICTPTNNVYFKQSRPLIRVDG